MCIPPWSVAEPRHHPGALTTDDGHYHDLARQVAATRDRLGPTRPLLVGISGAVGIGKSTLAETLARHLGGLGLATEIVATDGFLMPTAELERLGLMMRKGF